MLDDVTLYTVADVQKQHKAMLRAHAQPALAWLRKRYPMFVGAQFLTLTLIYTGMESLQRATASSGLLTVWGVLSMLCLAIVVWPLSLLPIPSDHAPTAQEAEVVLAAKIFCEGLSRGLDADDLARIISEHSHAIGDCQQHSRSWFNW